MAEAKQHETLAAALLAAQMEYPPLEKGSTVKVKTKTGGEYSYNYADLAYTKKVTDPYLWKHGLVIRDRTEMREGQEILVTTLTHVHSKEFETSELQVTDNTDMKGLGANITYARRYNYWNLTGRIGEDDSENRPLPRQGQRTPTADKPKQGQRTPPTTNTGNKASTELQAEQAATRDLQKAVLIKTGLTLGELRSQSGAAEINMSDIEQVRKYKAKLEVLDKS